MKSRFSLVALSLGLCALCGCEEADNEGLALGVENQALNVDSEAVAEEGTPGDGPSKPLKIDWLGLSIDNGKGSPGLTLRLTNISESTVRVQPTLVSMGLGSNTVSVALGKASLAPKQSQDFSIAAESLPIQSIKGATTMYAQIVSDTDTADGVHSRQILSQAHYVQHTEDYKNIKVFSTHGVMDKLGGKLHAKAEAADRGKGLGRIKNEKGAYDLVTDSLEKAQNDAGIEVFVEEVGIALPVGESL